MDILQMLMEAEVDPNKDRSILTAALRDARHHIMNLQLSETGAQNRAAELEREGGIPESLRRCATALERLARRHGYRGDD